MKKLTGKALGQALCARLGIDPAKVQRVSITADARRPARVVIVRLLDAEELNAVAELLKTKDPQEPREGT